MGLFGKKMTDEERIEQMQKAQQAELESQASDGEKKDDLGESKLGIEITKIKAQLEGFAEIRKATNERFSRIGEQIGELRGMIVDTNKTIGKIEVAATKAQDLVESVQPEKLMIDVRKMDGKIEALRAQLEAGEARNKDMMEEMKKIRHQMNFYKGVEQVTKMLDDLKKDTLENKKVQGVIERHSDKVETMFLDVSKKFAEFDQFNDVVKDVSGTNKKLLADFDKFRVKLEAKAEKQDYTKLLNSFNDLAKHTGNTLKLLDDRSKKAKDESKQLMDDLKKAVQKKYQVAAPEKKEEEKTEDKQITQKEEKEEEKPVEAPTEEKKEESKEEEKKE